MRQRLLTMALVLAVAGCSGSGGGSPTVGGLVDQLKAADDIGCYDRKNVPDDTGKIDTAGCFTRDSKRYGVTLTDNPSLVIAVARDDGATGPWVVGDGWLVVTDDEETALLILSELGGKIAYNARQAR